MPKLLIQATETRLTVEEIKEAVGASKLRELTGNGVLHAYVLAHEGVSRPRVIDEGVTPLTWPRSVIEKLQNVVKLGTKWFKGHGETNSHDKRKVVGETVGTLTKDVNGKAVSIVIGHFPNAEEVEKMDVVSMEAEVKTDGETVGDIDELTAVAMGNSAQDSPAFPGAHRLASLHCFDTLSTESAENLEKGVKKMPLTQEDLNTAPFEMLKNAIAARKVWPSQLFTVDDVKTDRVFSKDFDELSSLKTKTVELEKNLGDLKKTTEETTRKAAEATVKGTLETLLKTGVTDKQRAYILKKFDPATVKDLSETGLKAAVEELKKDYAETARLLGLPEKGESQTKTQTVNEGDEHAEPSGDAVADAVAEIMKD